MLRGHIWESRSFPRSVQESALQAAGVKVIYANEISAAITSLRAGDKLVVDGLRGMGRSREEIAANIKKVHARKAVVMDSETGKLSTSKHYKTLLEAAVKALANEKRGSRKRTKRDRRMPWDMVAIYYFDVRLSNAEVESAVAKGYVGMTYHTMRRHFKKPRGAPVGRPSAARKALR